MAATELREPAVYLLRALSDGPRHGWSLMQDVSALSAGRTELRPAGLYANLDRLVREGRVRVDREEVVGGRRRRWFAITDDGQAALAGHHRPAQEGTAGRPVLGRVIA
jgi:DNA-binding PadR family transcriptional regulator